MSVRYLKDLPTVRPLSKQEQVGSTEIDLGLASARQSEVRPERGKLIVDLHLGAFDPECHARSRRRNRQAH